MNSDQAAITAVLIGIMMCTMSRTSPTPSMYAASSISRGVLPKNCLNTSTPQLSISSGTKNTGKVFSRPSPATTR